MMMNRSKLLIPVAALCCLGTWIVSPAVSQTDRNFAGRSDEPEAVPAIQAIESFTEPYRDIAIAASEMGKLRDVPVREGDVVNEGDIIATLDDAVLQASLDVARASRDSIGALNTALADLKMKRSEVEKLEDLRTRDHASQREVDRVLAEVEIAEARVQSVREELNIKDLEFRRIQAQLEQRLVRAPISGIISDVKHDAGEFVSPSDSTIARIVQLDPLLVVFSVPLDQRNRFQKNETVVLRLGVTRTKTEGIVEYVALTADESNTSVRVNVRLPNPGNHWHSGERAELVSEPTSPGTTSSPLARR